MYNSCEQKAVAPKRQHTSNASYNSAKIAQNDSTPALCIHSHTRRSLLPLSILHVTSVFRLLISSVCGTYHIITQQDRRQYVLMYHKGSVPFDRGVYIGHAFVRTIDSIPFVVREYGGAHTQEESSWGDLANLAG